MSRGWRAAVLVCVAAIGQSMARAQVQPAGSEFHVNTFTTDAQSEPAVCRGPAGGMVVVWQSNNQDGRGWGIFGQRYNPRGRTLGTGFQVSTAMTGNQAHPGVACDPTGRFAVVWDSDQDGRIRGIFSQRYDRRGNPLGSEYPVNADASADSGLPAICSDADGNLAIAWQGYQIASELDIFARRYSSSGEPLGSQFQVNTQTPDAQARPAVACGPDGDFVVVWDSEGQDGSDSAVMGQRYSSTGTPQGFEFQINTFTHGMQRRPEVTPADGGFVVVWQTRAARSGYGVAGQRFDRAGTPVGSEFQVGSETASRQFRPAVAADVSGDFVVVWHATDRDANGYAVLGQRYDRHGIALGTEFVVNAYTTGHQRNPDVATAANGDFVVLWQSLGQDGSNDGVIGLRFSVCGNGVVDRGEECDDGNSASGDCCSAECEFEIVQRLWGDRRTCHEPPGEGVACPLLDRTNSTPCSDSSTCTQEDYCFQGVCLGGRALDCDDHNDCTTDSCHPFTGCVHAANREPCDDGNACTASDTCRAGACIGGPQADCDDGNPCTDDGCDPASGCAHRPSTAACDDGNACTASDTCRAGACIGAPPPDCDDGNACTDDACDPMAGCQNTPNAAPCDDHEPCTAGDTCVAGVCIGGAAPACDDGNACTGDACSPVFGCVHAASASPCDDGNACTQMDQCRNGACTGTQPVVCAAVDQCHTPGVCDPATGRCSTPPQYDGASCDDGDPCTAEDRCLAGSCLGTPGAPFLVRDIRPGDGSSSPAELTAAGGALYFRADDGAHGSELWTSAGTDDGTALVADIRPGPAGSSPRGFVDVDGVLLFGADDAAHGRELWRSDGTADGTALVKDIHPAGSADPRHLTNVNGTLLFVADDGESGAELWRSDGTADGTVLVKDIRPGRCGAAPCSSAPDQLTPSNGMLFFTADDGNHGTELWRSDGTDAGTMLVADIQPGAGASLPAFLTDLDGTVLFRAFNEANGYELWRSDGTDAGTVLVKDLWPGRCGRLPCSASPSNFINVGGRVFFGLSRRRTELWTSDGTAAGTVRVATLSATPYARASLNETLFFRDVDARAGAELWASDGTAAGTRRVADIRPGPAGSEPAWLTALNDTLYFSATDATTGTELWRSNGTAEGTVMVKDLNPGRDGPSPRSSSPASLTAVNGILFFSADDGQRGRELWALCEKRGWP